MDHNQFETQIAAILAAGIAGPRGANDPEAVVTLLVQIRDELQKRTVIVKQNANFMPKGR